MKKNELYLAWASIDYNIETEDTERISVDTINRLGERNLSTSSVVPHYSSLQNGLKMLSDRIDVLVYYLKDVKSGEIKKDFETLRQIKSLSFRLPLIDTDKFQTEYINQVNESLMITYLSTLTKATKQLDDLIEKYNSAYERRGKRGVY